MKQETIAKNELQDKLSNIENELSVFYQKIEETQKRFKKGVKKSIVQEAANYLKYIEMYLNQVREIKKEKKNQNTAEKIDVLMIVTNNFRTEIYTFLSNSI